MSIFSNRLIIERTRIASHSETDKELAKKLGTSPSTLGNWKEPKKKTPTLTELVFAYALNHNLDLNWLILGKESPALGEMETELLARFAKLDFKQKLELLNSLDKGDFAKNGTNQTACGDGNNQQIFSGDVKEVVGIKKTNHPYLQEMQALNRKIQANVDKVIPPEMQALSRKMQANVDKVIPPEMQALSRKIQALTANLPIDAMQRWQEMLAKSNDPEDFAIFHSPAYKETEKRVELGIAEEPEKQLVAFVGSWAKAKEVPKKILKAASSINTILELWERIMEMIIRSTGN
ncbi:helix-turn-helix domain-containing protein [Mannheimia pernigra]|uniref:helix-turn-helix domain-containing protein n=1 Tax=Mannheimia pernigra TaxID=111844 RepID=UPI001315FC3B|nr:helix-turn-helix domain-containing protein [Mannheimia pernigra]QHB17891.1 hypothetical protein GM695_07560 [Mannheimia pernigra]